MPSATMLTSPFDNPPARLHTREWGDPSDPTVVCVHGMTAEGGRFSNLVRHGLAADFHLVAPDLRGHGLSTWDPPWSIDQHLDDLLASVPADATLWIGHSFGGRLVLELAHRCPDRVQRAVLLDPALWVPPPIALERAARLRSQPAYESVAAAYEARDELKTFDADAQAAAKADLEAHLVLGSDDLYRYRYHRNAAICAFSELSVALPSARLTVPVLIVRADKSEVCPPELVDACRAVAGDLVSSVTVSAGHTLMWDAPTATNEAIVSFLKI
jgi:lipase